MHQSVQRFIATLCAALIMVVALPSGAADTYPSRPITIINPWAPGGAADIIIRPFGQKLGQALGTSVVVENVAGANGMIGTAKVAKAKPDGYMLIFSHVGPIAISPALQAQMSYDSVKDFEPITQMVSGPLVLVVRNELPIHDMKELLAYAKANPGALSYGSVGPGSTTHLAGEMVQQMTGAQLLHVPYKGNGPVITDMLGGQIQMAFINISGAMPYIKDNKFRPIAVTTLKRSAILPNLPTVAETLPGFEVNSWYGLMAPAGTPKDIVNRLQHESAAILRSPEMTQKLNEAGLDVEATTPDQYAAKIKSDIARWGTLVQKTGLKLQ